MKRLTVALLVLTLALAAQPVPQGSIRGVIRDSAQSTLPGVTVTLLPLGRTAVTDAHGRYQFQAVAPGTYEVSAYLAGMRNAQRRVVVRANQESAADLILALASVSETITVTAEAPLMRAMHMMAGGTVRVTAPVELTPRYRKFDDHGFIETKKSRVTTFAIDVDRASYANVRRFINEGLVPPPDAVRVEEINNKDFEDDEKDAGELGAGHSVTALLEIVPVSSSARSPNPIATLRLRYKEPNGRRSIPLTATITDEGRSAYEASPDMQFASAIAQFGMLLRNSPHKGTSSWDDLLKLAKVARK